jgi:hypothetical protein
MGGAIAQRAQDGRVAAVHGLPTGHHADPVEMVQGANLSFL